MPRDDKPSVLHTLLTTLAAVFGVAAVTGRFGRGGRQVTSRGEEAADDEGSGGEGAVSARVVGLSAQPSSAPTMPPGWGKPQPEKLARPTYWPVVLAMGITFVMWGLVSTPVVSLVGLIIFVVALGGWIGELRHE